MKRLGSAVLLMSLFCTVVAFAKGGDFAVSAKSKVGTAFHNDDNCKKHFYFKPSGLWSTNVQYWGYVGPSGDAQFNYPSNLSTRVAGVPTGAIIIQRGSGAFQAVGYELNIDLEIDETVHFLLNDGISQYNDNAGAMMVEWLTSDHC